VNLILFILGHGGQIVRFFRSRLLLYFSEPNFASEFADPTGVQKKNQANYPEKNFKNLGNLRRHRQNEPKISEKSRIRLSL
jgi:hypothetical protein